MHQDENETLNAADELYTAFVFLSASISTAAMRHWYTRWMFMLLVRQNLWDEARARAHIYYALRTKEQQNAPGGKDDQK